MKGGQILYIPETLLNTRLPSMHVKFCSSCSFGEEIKKKGVKVG